MADPTTCPPLIPSSIRTAYTKIQPYIHETPLLTSQSLDAIASSRDPAAFLSESPPTLSNEAGDGGHDLEPPPRFRLYFKCENFQKIGAFKARGAFHAVTRLMEEMGLEELRRRGVVTHSSGEFFYHHNICCSVPSTHEFSGCISCSVFCPVSV